MTIAIIGAGMAGLSAAERLSAAGRDVVLFDKGRGPGGRMSTRRMITPIGELRWDHGAQYFTAKSEAFNTVVAAWQEAGVVIRWEGPFADGARYPRYVGTPGMNDIIRYLAVPLAVRWRQHVARIEGHAGAWILTFEDGTIKGPFETVLVAVPAEQVAPLLEPVAPQLVAPAKSIQSDPCWTVLLAFDQPVDYAAGVRFASGPLAWIARNSAKPGRGIGETWVLHGAPAWSADHLDVSTNDVIATLVSVFARLTDAPQPIFQAAHRWRYAQVRAPIGAPAAFEKDLGLGTCGDWHLGARVEAAWQSGQAVAARVLEA